MARYQPRWQPRSSDLSVRERILTVAYDLFCHHGVRAIGIDRIIAEADVAKMSLYKHFRSKEELVLTVIERREDLWTHQWLQREIERRGGPPAARLLAVFDVYDDWFADWFRHDDYEGCFFTNTLLETHGPTNPIGAACARKMANIRLMLRGLAEDAGVRDPAEFAREWYVLMSGAIVTAERGDADAAERARRMALLLLAREGLSA